MTHKNKIGIVTVSVAIVLIVWLSAEGRKHTESEAPHNHKIEATLSAPDADTTAIVDTTAHTDSSSTQ